MPSLNALMSDVEVGMIILFLERRERMEDQRKQQTQFYVHFVNA